MLLFNALARFLLVVDLHIILFSFPRVKRLWAGVGRFASNYFLFFVAITAEM